MRFSIEISDLQLKTIATNFLAINGYQIWKDRADTLNRQIAQNPFLESHIRNRHRLELRLPKFVNLVRRKPHLSANDIQTFQDVAAFITAVSRLHDHVSEPGKKRLAGMLRDGLQDPNNGLLSLEHEMNTLVHLLSQGYDVTAHDLDQGTGFDYLATRDGAALEVECKMVTGDLGRMVPRRHVRMLYYVLKPVLEPLLAKHGGYFIHVQIPERLSANSALQQSISESIQRALRCDSEQDLADICSTSILHFPFVESPFSRGPPTYDQLQDFVSHRFGKRNVELLFAASSRCSAIVCVEGTTPDRQFQRLFDNLKRAAKYQLTADNPGCLVISFIDLTQEELRRVAQTDSTTPEKGNALQFVATALMERRPHILEVTYITPDASFTGQRHGFSYSFSNPFHPLSQDDRYRPFRIHDASAEV